MRKSSKARDRWEAWASALVLALSLPWLIPASWLFHAHSLAYESERRVMVQDREVPFTLNADWRAHIFELRGGEWVSVCFGGKDGTTYSAGRTPHAMSVDVWVGKVGCEAKMVHGRTYRAEASWTVNFLIWAWTETAESSPFTWP